MWGIKYAPPDSDTWQSDRCVRAFRMNMPSPRRLLSTCQNTRYNNPESSPPGKLKSYATVNRVFVSSTMTLPSRYKVDPVRSSETSATTNINTGVINQNVIILIFTVLTTSNLFIVDGLIVLCYEESNKSRYRKVKHFLPLSEKYKIESHRFLVM
jgi:hypothetical protein